VTGGRRTSDGIAEAIFAAGRRSDGPLIGARSIEVGLGAESVGQLEQRLAELSQRRRGRKSSHPAEASVIASAHRS
jgi:hypothetical protein